MRARWWHRVAAWVMCLSGIAVVVSRAHVVYRDPNLRSCRVYGLSDGFFIAHTYGSGSPIGLAVGYSAQGSLHRPSTAGLLLFGAYEYKPLNDPSAYYGSDWAIAVPLWLPWYICLPVLLPYLRERAAINVQRCERRHAAGRRMLRRSAVHAGVCPTCRYSLAGHATMPAHSPCPECGDPLTSKTVR